HLLIRLKEYVNDPIVNISMANFKVTVLGDVTRPGTFAIYNDKITLLEAIGMAGDLQITGKRDNIMVIREVDGEKRIYRVDLRAGNILNSPVYYLKQNDVVYVEPNKAKVNSSSYSATFGIIISAASLVITIISLILNISLK
ncbi:MAG TPA: sugar transporter, partial [Saprospirales bacterium]|nr:sugar transporter [Saprospirales bacterium]